MSVGNAMIASSRSLSMIHCLMLDSPDPAPPVKSGEPFSTMARRLPPSPPRTGCILEMRCSRNSSDPSETRGRPGPKRPAKPRCSCSSVTDFCWVFQATPNGGVGQQEVEVLGAEAFVGQGVAEVDVVNVLALDDHVGLAHRVRARVDIL